MLKHMKNGQWNQIWSRNSSRFENQVYNISPPFKEEKPGVSTRSRQEGGYTQLFLMWTEGKNSYRDVGRVMGNHRDGVGPPEPLEPQSWRAKGEKGLAELGEAAAWGEDPNQHALTPSDGVGWGGIQKVASWGNWGPSLSSPPLLPSATPSRKSEQEPGLPPTQNRREGTRGKEGQRLKGQHPTRHMDSVHTAQGKLATTLVKIKTNSPGASLVGSQWLRFCLAVQGTPVKRRVWSLVQEDPTCCQATKPVPHTTPESALCSPWATIAEPTGSHSWSPWSLEPVLHNERGHPNEKPPITTGQ